MSADEVKKQLEFERNIKVGDKCSAHWTNSGHYYQTEVEVVTVNSKSFGVKIATAIEGYPVGWRINIPNFLNIDRWTWNNRLAPQLEKVPTVAEYFPEAFEKQLAPQVDHYQEYLEAGVMPGNLEKEGGENDGRG